MMSISNKDALEQWRILYGDPERRAVGSNESHDKFSEGANDISEQPKASPDGAAG